MASTTVNFNLKTAGYVNYANQTLTFTLLNAGAIGTGDFIALPSSVSATSDANGDGSVTLFRNGDSGIDSVYEVVFPNKERIKFIIPAGTSTIELAKLIVENVPSGSSVQQSGVYSEAIKRANHTGTQTLSTISDATEGVEDIVGGMLTGNTETGITVTYQDADGTIDFVVEPETTSVARSISFTNTSAYLKLADAPALDVGTGDFSLSFFARLDSSGTEPVLTKLSGTGYRLKFVSGSLILTITDAVASNDFTLATSLNDNKWHTYVVTVDRSGNAIAYVDNVSQTPVSVSARSATLDNAGEFQIGSDGGSNPGDGIALGNYIVLHKAILSVSQAAQIYFSPDAALTALAPTLMVDLRRADGTFADVGTNGFAVTINGNIIFNEGRITALDNIPIGATTPAAITGTVITASTKFVGALDGTVGATTPAAVTGTSVLASTTLGYKVGSGGTVTQATSKTTAVTLNKISGEIVMDDAALADDATAVFTLTNSTIAATDVVIVNVASGVAVAGSYQVTVGAVAAGSCSISVLNVSGGSRTDTIKLNFAVIKAVAS